MKNARRPAADSGEPGHRAAPTDGTLPEARSSEAPPEDERVPITPTLVILGILAVALGVFSALVMSAQSLAP